MSKKFLTSIDLNKNEIQSAVIQNLSSAPASPVKGLVYFDTTLNKLGAYDGSGWVYYDGAQSTQAINAQSGTTYTFVLADAGKHVTGSNASATSFTVPPNASVAFPLYTRIDVSQVGAGKLTIVAGAGVTINSLAGNKACAGQYAGVSLYQTATNVWLLLGNLIA